MIKIICVGKIKEKYFKEAILEYQKRISKYTKIEIIEVPDFDSPIAKIELQKEMECIIKNIKEREYIITLEIEGTEMTSPSFSCFLDKKVMEYSTVTFIIGGSVGLHPLLKEKAHYKISFSPMTFPHKLFRIMLLEQIYRAYKIQKNETYHK